MSNKLIKKWEDIKELFPKWDNVLIGNGFSTNIWDDYAYKSLRHESTKRKIAPVLTDEILQIIGWLRSEYKGGGDTPWLN